MGESDSTARLHTAMLSVLGAIREKHDGLHSPEAGPCGPSPAPAGGVGVRVRLKSRRAFKTSYHVHHQSPPRGRMSEAPYLMGLGAAEVIDRNETVWSRPRSQAGCQVAPGRAEVDSVGSTTLATFWSMTKYGGAIAACGLSAGMDLPSSVGGLLFCAGCAFLSGSRFP